MEELKKCSLCGGKTSMFNISYRGEIYVTCTQCNNRTSAYATKQQAVDAWNKKNTRRGNTMKIWKETKEPEYFLRLVEYDGMPMLVIVDGHGEQISDGILVSISVGQLILGPSLNREAVTTLGIAVDKEGRIKLYD